MLDNEMAPVTLDKRSCLGRQERLREDLRDAGCQALLVRQRGNLSALFNYCSREVFPAAGLILANGISILSLWHRDGIDAATDEWVAYEATRLGSLKPNLADLALEPLIGRLPAGRIACDGDIPIELRSRAEWLDGRAMVAERRRSKDADEIALIEAAAMASEAAYRAVEPMIVPGTREIDLFAAFQSAAVSAAGQPLGELGNDYRGGAAGGMPRPLPLKAGDSAILDTGVMLRGYYSDLCRSYPVSGVWSGAQREAGERIVESLRLAEAIIAPGVSCASVFGKIHGFLDGFGGWTFKHHLGHGIGLDPVEAPRINPFWDDIFRVGDVFTLEPGLYGAELQAGLRIENNYVLLDSGLKRLSDSAVTLLA